MKKKGVADSLYKLKEGAHMEHLLYIIWKI